MSVKDTAFLGVIPSAYKSGKLYSILPADGSGDFTYNGPITFRNDSMGMVKNVVNNIPPLNYFVNDGDVNGFPELELNEARTNFVKGSNDFGNSSYWFASNMTIGAGITDSINATGVFGVNKIFANTSFANHYIQQTLQLSYPSQEYYFSMYVKPVNFIALNVELFNTNFILQEQVQYNFANESINKFDAQQEFGRMVKMPNGWYRIEAKLVPNSIAPRLRLTLMSQTGPQGQLTNTFSGNNVSGFLFYGCQFEGKLNGNDTPDASCYIPTTFSSITRTANKIVQNNAIDNFPTEYPVSVYWEGKIDRYAQGQRAWSLHNDSNANGYLQLIFQSDTLIRLERRDLSQSAPVVNTFSYRTMKRDYLKILVVFYNSNDVGIYVNGVRIALSYLTNANYDVNRINIGSMLNDFSDSGHRQSFKQFFLFKRAFTDDEARSITAYDSYSQMAESMNLKIA